MDSMEGLRLGMFLGGLIVAAVPISLAIGVAIYAWRRHRQSTGEARRDQLAEAAEAGGTGSDPRIEAGGLP